MNHTVMGLSSSGKCSTHQCALDWCCNDAHHTSALKMAVAQHNIQVLLDLCMLPTEQACTDIST